MSAGQMVEDVKLAVNGKNKVTSTEERADGTIHNRRYWIK
jgi:hypothetical protein